MKNNNIKPNSNYQGLSKDEVYLISRAEYEKQKIVTRAFTLKLFNNPKKTDNILDELRRKGRLLQIEKGKYFIVPMKAPNQLWVPNEFVTAKYWIGEASYYIGYFTMYNYWGFTEQIPQTMYVLNTKKSKTKVIADTKYKAVKITKEKYYGIKKIKIEGEEIIISDRERTLVDLVDNPPGSFNIMRGILKDNIGKIDCDKFTDYLVRYPVKAVLKRAGCIMAALGVQNNLLNRLKDNIGNAGTYVVLNPENQNRKGRVNKEWGLIINE
ncbi:MAG: type IV toxin-antitoxin system AbiEi family antitoxin [Elusimicrobiota bacterium]